MNLTDRLDTLPAAERTDRELVAKCRRSDEAAITELIRRHYPTSIRIAGSILRNRQDSEDAVQMAYCQAFQRLSTFREEARFSTWITSIVVNQSRMHLRRARRATLVSLEEPAWERASQRLRSWEATPEESTARKELSHAIWSAVERLPNALRSAYTLHEVSGLPIAEVARKLGLSVAATKTRIFRARRTLESRLCRRYGPASATAQ
jgi:RNA polymerase sigma-70 factor (ECF subfamily)